MASREIQATQVRLINSAIPLNQNKEMWEISSDRTALGPFGQTLPFVSFFFFFFFFLCFGTGPYARPEIKQVHLHDGFGEAPNQIKHLNLARTAGVQRRL